MKRARGQLEPDQGWSWLVLLAAFFCHVTFDGIIYSFGVFYLEFLDHFQEGRARTAWIGSVIGGTYAIVGPLASVLANKFGCKLVTMAGALLSSLGFILCTFSSNIITMICTFSIMGGIGFGMMYLCAYVMVGHYFEKYRALATGIASCGSGIGMFVFAPLSVVLIEYFTWKGAIWILAGIVLNGVVMGALFRPFSASPSPSSLVVDEFGEKSTEKVPLIDLTLLLSPVFILLCLSSFLCMIGFFIPFTYLPDYARDIGLSKGQGAILLSIIGIANTLGRIVSGFASDKPWADALKINNAALILGGLVTIGCCWIRSFPLLCVYAVIFGTCIAAYVSLTAILLVEFLGLHRLCSSFGLLNMFRGISTFIGAPLAGFLFDTSGSYDVPFYTAGTVILCAGLICLPLRLVQESDCTLSKAIKPNNTPVPKEKKPLTESQPEDQPGFYLNAIDKHRQLLNDKSLYSSTLHLSGSQISISLPNPYITQVQSPVCDRGSLLDIPSNNTGTSNTNMENISSTDSKLSQSDSCLCCQSS